MAVAEAVGLSPNKRRTVRSASTAVMCFSGRARNAVSLLSIVELILSSRTIRLRLLPVSIKTREFVFFSADALPHGPSNSLTSPTILSASSPSSGRTILSNSLAPRVANSAISMLGIEVGGIPLSMFNETRNWSRRISTKPFGNR